MSMLKRGDRFRWRGALLLCVQSSEDHGGAVGEACRAKHLCDGDWFGPPLPGPSFLVRASEPAKMPRPRLPA